MAWYHGRIDLFPSSKLLLLVWEFVAMTSSVSVSVGYCFEPSHRKYPLIEEQHFYDFVVHYLLLMLVPMMLGLLLAHEYCWGSHYPLSPLL